MCDAWCKIEKINCSQVYSSVCNYKWKQVTVNTIPLHLILTVKEKIRHTYKIKKYNVIIIYKLFVIDKLIVIKVCWKETIPW